MSLYGFGVSEKAYLIGGHINDLMKYLEELRLYWSKSFIDDRKSQLEEIIKIKSLYISVQTFYGHHASSLFTSNVLSEYQKITQKLIYVMTAGDSVPIRGVESSATGAVRAGRQAPSGAK